MAVIIPNTIPAMMKNRGLDSDIGGPSYAETDPAETTDSEMDSGEWSDVEAPSDEAEDTDTESSLLRAVLFVPE